MEQLETRTCVHVFYARDGGGEESMTALFINGDDIMEAKERFQKVKRNCRIKRMQRYDRLNKEYYGEIVEI